MPPSTGCRRGTCTHSPHPRSGGGNSTSASDRRTPITPSATHPRRSRPCWRRPRARTPSPCTASPTSASRRTSTTHSIRRPIARPTPTDVTPWGPISSTTASARTRTRPPTGRCSTTRPPTPQFLGLFQAPTMRNVDLRPSPTFVKAYFHNGWAKSLQTVVHFYNKRNIAVNAARAGGGLRPHGRSPRGLHPAVFASGGPHQRQ